MDKKYFINLQGKDFVLHEGLLNEFHTNGGTELKTEMLPSADGMYIFKATATGAKGIFTGHGDADNTNVNSMIARHKLRMAETRAINRALRLYCNIGMCSADELGGSDYVEPKTVPAPRQSNANAPNTGLKLKPCDRCGKELKLKSGSKGQFYACLGYPACKRTLDVDTARDMWKVKKTADSTPSIVGVKTTGFSDVMPPDYNNNDF